MCGQSDPDLHAKRIGNPANALIEFFVGEGEGGHGWTLERRMGWRHPGILRDRIGYSSAVIPAKRAKRAPSRDPVRSVSEVPDWIPDSHSPLRFEQLPG